MSARSDVYARDEGPLGDLRWESLEEPWEVQSAPFDPTAEGDVTERAAAEGGVVDRAAAEADLADRAAADGEVAAPSAVPSTAPATVPPAETPTGGRTLRRTRRTLAFVVVGAISLCVGGLASSFLIKSPAERAAETAPPSRSVLTAQVERRVVQATVILQGEIASRQQTTVSPQPATDGTSPVITAVRVKAGDTVKAGKVLAEVSARPVIVLPGAIPVYRDLKPDDRGADVTQLQAALTGLGHRPRGDVRGYYGAATKAAVKALYTRLGYDVSLAGGPDNEALTSAQQTLRQAQRALDQLVAQGTSGGSGATGSGAGGTGSAGTGSPSAGQGGSAATGGSGASRALQLRYAREDRDRARAALTQAQAKAGAMVPAAEVIFLPSLPARVVSVNAPVGRAVPSNMLVLSSGALQVKAKLPPYQHGRVAAGQKVTVISDDTGTSYAGVVASVGGAPVSDAAAAAGGGSDGGASGGGASGGGGSSGGDGGQEGQLYYPVTISSTKALDPSLQGLSVRITVAKSSTAGPVLAVPSSAISSGTDGSTIVTVQKAGGSLTTVRVTAGVSGDGFVEVKPAGSALKVGDQVVVGR